MKPLTIGAVAEHFGVSPWQVRRLFERGMLLPAARVGAYRVVESSDLPEIKKALQNAGYLPRHEAAGREGNRG
jgi:DNA-binding transcriptional MerR regulator